MKILFVVFLFLLFSGNVTAEEVVSSFGIKLPPGFRLPYHSYKNLMRQYDGNRCKHRGIDIGSVGSRYGGVGTPVFSITDAKVTLIGRSSKDPKAFGRLDKRKGHVLRTGRKYPRAIKVKNYGTVYPFTRDYGKWRSGNVVVTEITEGVYKGYTIRYMHLADIRKDLKVGSRLKAGEELGLTGGTAVLSSWPHLHLDMSDAQKRRIDPAPFIGLPGTAHRCGEPEIKIEDAEDVTGDDTSYHAVAAEKIEDKTTKNTEEADEEKRETSEEDIVAAEKDWEKFGGEKDTVSPKKKPKKNKKADKKTKKKINEPKVKKTGKNDKKTGKNNKKTGKNEKKIKKKNKRAESQKSKKGR